MSNKVFASQEVLDANIEVHSELANSGEYNRSPHFNKENRDKVQSVLKTLISRTSEGEKSKLLDMGCGTGFIIDLVVDLVASIEGVDITEDMMRLIDTSSGKVNLTIAPVEALPFEASDFDIVTAYSFLDHLLDYRQALSEAYRVLKPGGLFYSGLNPNRGFTQMLQRIENTDRGDSLPPAIAREIKGMLHNAEYQNESFGLREEAMSKAEPEKTLKGGFDVSEVLGFAQSIGFKEVECRYEWFLGQGLLMNSSSTIDLSSVDDYLREMLPATADLYKYLQFIFLK